MRARRGFYRGRERWDGERGDTRATEWKTERRRRRTWFDNTASIQVPRMPPLPFSFLCVSDCTPLPHPFLSRHPPRRFSNWIAATTQDCKYRRRWSISLSRATMSIFIPPPSPFSVSLSLSSTESPINSRHRGYSDRAAKICGTRGAVNKCAISLREIMHGSHLSKHLRQSSSCCEILDHLSLHLRRYTCIHLC